MVESELNFIPNVPNNSAQNENNGGNLDPLFIANYDNPTTSLVSVAFTGTNFIRCSRNVRRVLIAKNKEGSSLDYCLNLKLVVKIIRNGLEQIIW